VSDSDSEPDRSLTGRRRQSPNWKRSVKPASAEGGAATPMLGWRRVVLPDIESLIAAAVFSRRPWPSISSRLYPECLSGPRAERMRLCIYRPRTDGGGPGFRAEPHRSVDGDGPRPGLPALPYYQHLAYLLPAALYLLVTSFRGSVPLADVFNWTGYLLLSLFPLSIYWSMRRFGFSRLQAGLRRAGKLPDRHKRPVRPGIRSYVWYGYG